MPLLQEPAVTLEGASLASLSVTSLELDVAIRVQNNNRIGVTLRELPFRVLCRDKETSRLIASGNTGRVTIAAKSGTLLHVPVKSDNAILIGALAAFVSRGNVQVTIKGTAVIDCLLFSWSVPFTKTIPVTVDLVVKAACGKKNP